MSQFTATEPPIFIRKLEQQLHQPLPGMAAQNRLAHKVRRSNPGIPAHARKAGVLLLVYPGQHNWQLVLIRRPPATHANDAHGGQISFPGGAYEQHDANLTATALREAHEEVGVDPQLVRVLGKLTPLYIPVSNFKVQPIVGWCKQRPHFRADTGEVAEIIEISLSKFLDIDNFQLQNIALSERLTLRNVPTYTIAGNIIWGATAMMLSEFFTLAEVFTNKE